jgi:hypothetical protein
LPFRRPSRKARRRSSSAATMPAVIAVDRTEAT